ncbi:MAG: hypothetical protein JXR95_16060 [Deltaproteobacteria bacterium]|nr:hypothetical protein [Deltaproteobacteria bacterium]
MKNKTLFVLLVAAMAFSGCKSKKQESAAEGTKNLKKASADLKNELGFKPKMLVAINIKNAKSSPLFGMVKDEIGKDFPGGKECFKPALEKAEAAVLIGDNIIGKKVKAGEKKTPNAYGAITGIDGKALIECAMKSAKGKDQLKTGKLNGKDVWINTDDGETTYIWVTKNGLGVVSGELSKKVTPGKGVLGNTEIGGFVGSKTVTLDVSGINEDKLEAAKGYMDFSSGISANIDITFKDAGAGDKALAQFKMFSEKGEKMIPVPGIGEIIKGISLKGSGKNLTLSVSLSKKQVEMLSDLAKSMGGGFMK